MYLISVQMVVIGCRVKIVAYSIFYKVKSVYANVNLQPITLFAFGSMVFAIPTKLARAVVLNLFYAIFHFATPNLNIPLPMQ